MTHRRCTCPECGRVVPVTMGGRARQHRLIHPVGRYVTREVCSGSGEKPDLVWGGAGPAAAAGGAP